MNNTKKISLLLFACTALSTTPTNCLFYNDNGGNVMGPALTGAAIGGIAGGRRGAGIGLGVGLLAGAASSAAANDRRDREEREYYRRREEEDRRRYRGRRGDKSPEELAEENETLKQQLSEMQRSKY
jgi:hypothetical protein